MSERYDFDGALRSRHGVDDAELLLKETACESTGHRQPGYLGDRMPIREISDVGPLVRVRKYNECALLGVAGAVLRAADRVCLGHAQPAGSRGRGGV